MNGSSKDVYILVFDGMADWEAALALCEIMKKDKMDVISLGFSQEPVTTMGGLKLLPDMALNDAEPEDMALFILPGGEMWEKEEHPLLQTLLKNLKNMGVPIASICGAVLSLARAGILKDTRHTSNYRGYIEGIVPDYAGKKNYVDDSLAVTDNGVITASGVGYVEFAREIIDLLKIYSPELTEAWYQLFKYGRITEEYLKHIQK